MAWRRATQRQPRPASMVDMARRDEVLVDDDKAREIADRYGLQVDEFSKMGSPGSINSIYTLGDGFVLRVPRDHPNHVEQAQREAAAIPLAVAAGVTTPGLVAFDESREVLPVPYLIVERVDGIDAEQRQLSAEQTDAMWHLIGRDLARLHAAVVPTAGNAAATPDHAFAFADPRTAIEDRQREGWISAHEARWIAGWLDALAPDGAAPQAPCIVHGDLQMSNVLLSDTGSATLIDWGCARLDDPVADFLAMPMAAVPPLLAGHREISPLPDDDRAEARILWRRLQMLIAVLPRGAAPGSSWGERPVGWLVDLLRFFLSPPKDSAWRALAPPHQP